MSSSLQVTDYVSYVVSPNFNGLENLYPNAFQGIFFLNVTFGHSVLTNFLVFVTEPIPEEHPSCSTEFLEIEDIAESRKTKLCGLQVNHMCLFFPYIYTNIVNFI